MNGVNYGLDARMEDWGIFSITSSLWLAVFVVSMLERGDVDYFGCEINYSVVVNADEEYKRVSGSSII